MSSGFLGCSPKKLLEKKEQEVYAHDDVSPLFEAGHVGFEEKIRALLRGSSMWQQPTLNPKP